MSSLRISKGRLLVHSIHYSDPNTNHCLPTRVSATFTIKHSSATTCHTATIPTANDNGTIVDPISDLLYEVGFTCPVLDQQPDFLVTVDLRWANPNLTPAGSRSQNDVQSTQTQHRNTPNTIVAVSGTDSITQTDRLNRLQLKPSGPVQAPTISIDITIHIAEEDPETSPGPPRSPTPPQVILRDENPLLTEEQRNARQVLLRYLTRGDSAARLDNETNDTPGDFNYLCRVYNKLLVANSRVRDITDPGNRQIYSDRDHDYASAIISIDNRIEKELRRLGHVDEIDEQQRSITNRTMAGIGTDLEQLDRKYQQGN